MTQEDFMNEAVKLSAEAIEKNTGGPFGCIIIKDGKIVGKGSNHVNTTCDPTAHAEVMAIRDASKNLKTPELVGCEMYTSSEPCPMCLAAAYWACISKIYYANTVADGANLGYEDAIIYEEMKKPPESRKVAMIHQPSAAAKKIFSYWKELNKNSSSRCS